MLRRVPPLLRWGGLVCLVCLLPLHAGAQTTDDATRDAARSLGLSGVDAYQAGNYDTASDRLEKAYSLMNVPSLGLWSARALSKRNRLVEAASRYLEVVSLQLPQGDAAVQRQAQADAQTELDRLRPQIPRLTIRVNGADPSEVSLTIDGQAVAASILGKPRLINPGSHQVEAQVASTHKTESVSLQLGKEDSLVFDFAPTGGATASPHDQGPAHDQGSSSRRTLGWVGVAAGGVGVALGAVTGGMALGKRSSLKDGGCTDTHCPATKQADVNSLNTFRTVSTVGFIAGGVLAATGVVILLSAPSSEHPVTATVSGEAVTLSGWF